MPLFTIARLCEQETARFWQKEPHDPRYCYALWQRAIIEIQQEQAEAWHFVYRIYARQVRLWVKKHHLFPALDISEVDLADLVFEKMWQSFANDPQKLNRFPQEPSRALPALLDFLKTCIRSVIIDTHRRSRSDTDELEKADHQKTVSELRPIEEAHHAEAYENRFWQCTVRRLKNDKEKIVIAAMFIDGLPPRKVALAYPEQFKDAQEVSRIKNRVMRRLQNDLSFADCVGYDGNRKK